MSVDIATLGIRVDASQVDPAATRLDKLAAAGTRAERETTRLGGATDMLKNAMGGLGIITTVEAATQFLTTAMTKSIGAAKEFSRTMGEISTLVDETKWSIGDLSEEIKKQAAAYGSNVGLQGAAMYEIISSGATDAADATNQLTFANKLAVAGMTTVATSADGLTSVINAYGKDVLSAQAASDSMFTAMLYGKLKIEDLASGLGNVAPIAQTLGVSFDELTGSIAALTKGGVSSNTAITGVRAILASVAKPSSEAAKLAEKLGIQFDSTGLKAMGLAGFMEHVKEKTHGNTDAMAILFGGVEALVPALDLTGKAGVAFAEIMKEMADKAGATDEALAKINATPAQQLNVIMSTLGVSALNAGQSVLNFFGPAIAGLANILTGAAEPGWALDAALKALAATAGVLVIRAIVGMTGALVAWTVATVTGSTAVMGFTAMVQVMGVRAALATVAMTGLRGAMAGTMALLGGPWGIALAAAAAAIYLIYQHSNKATQASATYTKAQSELAAVQAQTKTITERLASATGQSRVEAVAAAKAAQQLAIQRVYQARTALQAAMAERQLAAATAQKNIEQSMSSTRGAGGGIDPGMVAIGAGTRMREQADANARQAIANLKGEVENLNTLTNSLKAPVGVAAPNAPKLDLDTSDPKKVRGAKGDKDAGKSDAQREAEERIKTAKEFAENLKLETSQIGMNTIELKMAEAQRAAMKAPTLALKDAILLEADAWKAATVAEANKKFKQDYSDQADQIKYESTLIGLNTFEVEKANIHRAIALRIRDAERNGITLDISNIEAETKALLDNVDARENQLAAADHAHKIADGMRDAADAVRDMTEGFGELFGTAGEGFSNLVNTLFEYQATQAEIAEQQADIASKYRDDQAMSATDSAEYHRLENEAARNRVANYGNMLGAAKSFFKEGSTGYKILEGAERAYRLFQFAMQAKAIVMDLLQTGSSVANSGTRAAASGVEAVAKAMASLPPPVNFIAAGAVIAFLVAMGVKMVGGKGGGKGAGGGSSSASSATIKEPAYNGPRDEYGAPTSSYSVLKPGATLANDNTRSYSNAANSGGGFRGGDVTIQIQGGADMRTIQEQVVPMLQAQSDKTIEEARVAVAADLAAQAGRQRIGG